MKSKLIIILLVVLGISQTAHCFKWRYVRNIGANNGPKSVSAPLLGDEIDLETIGGVEQVTKLVLIKTDSLPGESSERVDGRFLNSIMETLYTGLRKPFKSVSADILGIFPTFREIQVRCDRSAPNELLERDESLTVKRRSTNSQNSSSREEVFNQADEYLKIDDRKNETNADIDLNYMAQSPHKSSLQVCRAVTDDCLSMKNLVEILPPKINTFDEALVRLCPIMLFRIMNSLCQKSSTPFSARHQDEFISAYQGEITEESEDSGQNSKKDSITLNNLLRTKMLNNLQNSDELGAKKPQKLHKKLKTQTPYKTNGLLNSVNSQQHGSVDEQLLKLRLKLSEPSIEKVWIFSLLFVILSIVVSMGGLIVLPFVKKTTRRRILTLFEGLAVGGLAGSATLHMFPQAFGLVDENYHKYFWRIFVVFFGIYLCYLCERIIKILKVMRTRMKRRSRASLTDMDFCYGFPSVSREISRNRSRSRSSRTLDMDYDFDLTPTSPHVVAKRKSGHKEMDVHPYEACKECARSSHSKKRNSKVRPKSDEISSAPSKKGKSDKKKQARGSFKRKRSAQDDVPRAELSDVQSIDNTSDIDSGSIGASPSNPARQRIRLIKCLKSVQGQFSPVYAVQTQNLENTVQPKDEPRAGRMMRLTSYPETRSKSKRAEQLLSKLKRKTQETGPLFGGAQGGDKTYAKRYRKQRETETMLYHQRAIGHQHGRNRARLERGYLQQRLSSVNDVAAERQDQDNAARMSVDTVAWMIVFGDAVLNVIDGLSIGAAFERNILAGISISVAVMLEEVTHRLGTFAVLIRAGMSMQQSLLCTFLSACALFPGLVVGILLSDATEDATPYIFCAAGGIFLYMALVDVMKEMNQSIENAIRKDIKSTLQIFALQNVGIVVAVIFLSFLALYEQAMDFEGYQNQYNQPSK